jgi:alcohol dehydrogenase class IV
MLERHFNTPERKSFRLGTRLHSGINARLDLPTVLPQGPILLVIDEHFVGCDAGERLNPAHTIVIAREPSLEDAQNALASFPEPSFASVVAIGGGSSIDMAKALHAHLSFGRFDARDVERPEGAPVLVAVPTTAGSGSETSRFFILSDGNGTKRSYRAWSHAPDVAVLDPAFLREAGAERITLGAFDAFVHLWETYICRNERDQMIDMLALEGVPLIAGAIEAVADGHQLDDELLSGLQRASALAGAAIANVRTGLIHTLAESLAPQVALSHAETLWVFFDAALASYDHAVEDRIQRLDRRLRADLGPHQGFGRLMTLWHELFNGLGITERIESELESSIDIDALIATAGRDTVLVKENPVPLRPQDLIEIVSRRLSLNIYTPDRRRIG